MRKEATLVALCMCFGTTAYADDQKDKNRYDTTCPQIVVDKVDSTTYVDAGGTGFGPDASGNSASTLTTCLGVRERISIVAAINSDAINGASGYGQQIKNIENIVNDYESNYGMVSGDDFQLVAVGYGQGLKWLADDGVAGDTALEASIKRLIAKGVRFYACQNTMKGQKLLTTKLIPGVQMVPAGVTAVVDFQKRGYTYITP